VVISLFVFKRSMVKGEEEEEGDKGGGGGYMIK